LQILVNDTESTEIQIDNFKVDPSGDWNADITVIIFDHFGLDKADALKYQGDHLGFAAWWLLQYTRNHRPFETKIVVKKNC
jgi:Protein of unknown function (DUF3289)